jgi:hypothetical protein
MNQIAHRGSTVADKTGGSAYHAIEQFAAEEQ